MRITCGCLNIKFEVGSFFELEVINLDLNSQEICHPYFSKDVYKITGKLNGISETHPRLIKNEIVGSWNICQCLICKAFTHATNYISGLATCSSVLCEEPTDLKAFGRERNISYSQVFQVCFPCRLDVPDDMAPDVPNCDIIDADFKSKIKKQASSFLEMAEKRMRLNARTPVEKQNQVMEALRRRVQCEERVLYMLFLQSKTELPEHLHCPTVSGNLNPYYGEFETSVEYLHESKSDENAIHDSDLRTLQMSLMNTNTIEDELQRLQINNACPPDSPKDISRSNLEEDDVIFVMDEDLQSTIGSNRPTWKDFELYPGGGIDEETDTSRNHEKENMLLAKSVPLNIPSWPNALDRRMSEINSKSPKDPEEIAASMRQIARSMRTSSVDVFGELPKPSRASKSKFVP